MKYVNLGNTGLSISQLGLGGIPLQRISEAAAIELVHYCLDSGINFIDTARAYTDSEMKIGQAIKDYPREKFVLATKSMARTREAMARDIEASLLNLQTEYIDLYQCHNVRFDEDEATIFGADGAMEALLAAQQAGKIRHIGLTCHQVDRALRLIQTGKFATVQVPYNFNEDLAATELLPLAEKLGIGVIVMKPLGGGALPAEAAIRYFLDKPVSTVIPGMDSLCQVKDNIEYINSGQALNAEEMAKIADIKKEIGQKYCRRCDYCRPCPQGIDISGLFIVHGYYSRYSMQDWAISRYSSFAVKPDACVECGICESRCPYDLPIRQMLKQVYQDMN